VPAGFFHAQIRVDDDDEHVALVYKTGTDGTMMMCPACTACNEFQEACLAVIA
jgi:hypothetical protein